MSAAVLPFDPLAEARAGTARALAPLRQIGGTDIVFARRAEATIALETGERGGYRVRTPRGEHGAEAVLINTGGGMAGGDRVEHAVVAGAGTEALVTTPAAERVYRTLGPRTEVQVRLVAEDGARMFWMPQETILYSGAALARRMDADIAARASLLVLEMTALGRKAMGETMGQGLLRDSWRVRRGGRLVYADQVAIEGDIGATLRRPAVGGGASVLATLLYVAPDAGDRLDAVRSALLTAGDEAGASAWNGMLVARLVGSSLSAARGYVARVLPLLMRRAMPRTWWT